MKKIVIFSLILAMAAGAAFAQLANGISVNGWGRGAFSPLMIATDKDFDGTKADDTGGVYTGIGATWGGDQVRTDFRINANSENVGFVITFTESGIGTGDDGAHIWVKPFGTDMLKLTAGRFANDTLRGKVGSVNSGFECFSLPLNNEEDQIFNRFGSGAVDSTSAVLNEAGSWMISSAPIDGLFIGLMVNGAIDPWWGRDLNGATLAGDAYRFMQLGAGYEIAGTAHIRAQWIGGWAGTLDMEKLAENKGKGKISTYPGAEIWGPKEDHWENGTWVQGDGWATGGESKGYDENMNPGRIEAAVALLSVDNLLLDLGLKFWMPIKMKDYDEFEYFKGVDVSLGATYRMDAFNIAARVDAKGIAGHTYTIKDDKSADSMEIDVRLTPAYDFDAATVGLDFGLRIGTASKNAAGDDGKDGTTEVGFGLFVKKGFGNGHVKTGATFTLAPTTDGKTTGGRNIFRIPVVLEYAFF
jgi:hypothetical protein